MSRFLIPTDEDYRTKLTIDPINGQDFYDLSKDAIGLADKHCLPVEFVFRSTPIRLMPGMTPRTAQGIYADNRRLIWTKGKW